MLKLTDDFYVIPNNIWCKFKKEFDAPDYDDKANRLDTTHKQYDIWINNERIYESLSKEHFEKTWKDLINELGPVDKPKWAPLKKDAS